MNEADQQLESARALLKRAVPGLSERAQAELAVELAHALLAASQAQATRDEQARARQLAALMEDEKGQAFATALTDRVHRSKSGAQLVRQVRALIAEFGVPMSLPRLDRLELRALWRFGSALPELTAAAVKKRIYDDASPYIVPADAHVLSSYLSRMEGQNVRVNVNHLGEEVLGEREADRHLAAYLDLLQREFVSTISVKISSLYSQLRPLAWDYCLDVLAQRLRCIYRQALLGERHKLVYLDMESYRDLAMTVAVFTRVLDEPEFYGLLAGVVLQAYVPDSVHYQRLLTEWALARVAAGKAPIRVRLVKGANLAMERLEASQRGWPLATYGSKHEVDANYKRLLSFACRPDHARAVRVGVASHNLFDLAYTLVLRKCHGIEAWVELEMLEGMAQALRRAVQAVAGSVLVYAPSVDERNFPAAVAYLVRRLDENTGEDNFLRHSFGMRPGDQRFQEQAAAFLQAFEARSAASSVSRRAAERRQLGRQQPAEGFENEPDTDFTNPNNREWMLDALQRAQTLELELELCIGGKRRQDGEQRFGFDPSRPGRKPYRYTLASEELLDTALVEAQRAALAWGRTTPAERAELLLKAAERLRGARAELVSHMLLDAGKRVEEADTEVSEAIDFIEYYARQFLRLTERFETRPKGVVVVTPPWNFPLAIPTGGVMAALVAGNSVILKPAPETVLVAATLVRLCHEAGVPESVLQFVVADDEVGSLLITDSRVSSVVLTGATETAHLFHRLRPRLDLVAETGGKNAIYVSDLSDREQACRHVVHSAFSHAGQKCSACSLLLLHRDLYYDESFRGQLLDATRSLPVGSAWQPQSFVTPLIRVPSGALLRGLRLDQGEEWLLEPSQDGENRRLLSPGIKWNVRPGSVSHLTEFFGPLLSVLQVSGVEQALELIHGTGYGLTAGIQSLDSAECAVFADGVDAGNLYLNHPVTGAVVGRQPFGGRRASGFGPGAKAGGPNYVAQFCHVTGRVTRAQLPALSRGPRLEQVFSGPSAAPPGLEDLERLRELARLLPQAERSVFEARAQNYEQARDLEFAREHPQDAVLGQHNVLRYQVSSLLLLLPPRCSALDALSCLLAVRIVGGAPVVLMSAELRQRSIFDRLAVEAYYESSAMVQEYVARGKLERLRCPGELPSELWSLPTTLSVSIEAGPAHDEGYVELRHYLKEQVVCTSYHRYGNLSQPQGVPSARSRPH